MSFFNKFITGNGTPQSKPAESLHDNFSIEKLGYDDTPSIKIFDGVEFKNTKHFKNVIDSYVNVLNLDLPTVKHFSMEADEDPFGDIGDGMDDDFGGDDGGDPFGDMGDSSDDFFGGDDGGSAWGDGSDDGGEGGNTNSMYNIARDDLLSENTNVGRHIRLTIPSKIEELLVTLDKNIDVVSNHTYDGQYTQDFITIKETYRNIKSLVEDYIDIIDTKTFEDLFVNYFQFISLIDNANELYTKVTNKIHKKDKK
ncbi:MAG: hypothetical protein ACRC92_14780 [Peptostreptococcaceae bacterium]